MVNSCKADVDFIKKMFSTERINAMDSAAENVKTFKFDLTVLKVDLENCAKLEKIGELENRMRKFATQDMVNDQRDDIEDKATRQEIQIVLDENTEIKKSIRDFVSGPELRHRISVLNNDFNLKLDNRPTKDWVNTQLNNYD